MDSEAEERTNERGNVMVSRFVGPNRERYHYDFEACAASKGWTQYDTSQDAWYFGVWVHPVDLLVLTFAEGDETLTTCATPESFKAELASMADFYGDPPPAIRVIHSDGSRTDIYDERTTEAAR